MPRIHQKKREYLLTDFRKWLIGELKVRGIKQSEVAKWYGITQQSVSRKIKDGDFNVPELIVLFDELGTEPEQIGKLMR